MKFEQMRYKFITFFVVIAFVLIFAPTVKAEAAAFRQTDATADTVTVSWDNTYNNYVQGYHIYVGGSNIPINVSSNVNSYKISQLKQGCAYSVLILCVLDNREYYFDSTSHDYILVRTQPKQMSSKSYKVSWNEKNRITVKYTDESSYTEDRYVWYKYFDGIEFRVKDINGKKKKTIVKTPAKSVYSNSSSNLIDSFTFKAPSAIKDKGMQYQIRTYIQLGNGKKIYSSWTKTKVFIPQAQISKVAELKSGKVQVTWKKVANAENYTIWKTTNGGKSYTKVQTVNANTTSYAVSDYETGDANGVVITATVKIGKKRYNSQKSYYTFYN